MSLSLYANDLRSVLPYSTAILNSVIFTLSIYVEKIFKKRKKNKIARARQLQLQQQQLQQQQQQLQAHGTDAKSVAVAQRAPPPDHNLVAETMKRRILIVLLVGCVLTANTYYVSCSQEGLSFLECFPFSQDRNIFLIIIMAIIMNSTLFVGPIYQDYKQQRLLVKFKNMETNRFRWDEFKRLTMGPVIEDWIFFQLTKTLLNPDYSNNAQYIIVSSLLFGLAHLHNYQRFKKRIHKKFVVKATLIQIIYSFLLGIYLTLMLVKTRSIVTSIIIHGYCNFYGHPNIIELLQLDYNQDEAWKILRFYIGGLLGFFAECFVML